MSAPPALPALPERLRRFYPLAVTLLVFAVVALLIVWQAQRSEPYVPLRGNLYTGAMGYARQRDGSLTPVFIVEGGVLGSGALDPMFPPEEKPGFSG